MSIPVSEALLRLDNLMNDDDRIRWDEAERIRWFNDAGKAIIARRPAARAVTATLTLLAGTAQVAPVGAAQVLDVIRNVTVAGAPSKAITVVDRQALDRADPDWHTGRAGITRHFMVDDRSPTTFYVWPPAVAGSKVDALLAEPPPDVAQPDDTIDLRPEFMDALLNWALYRCHTKDSEYAQGAVAAQHYQAFQDVVGSAAQAEQANSPQGNSV